MSKIDDFFHNMEDSKVFDEYVYTLGGHIKDNVLYVDLLLPAVENVNEYKAISVRMPILPGLVATALRIHDIINQYAVDQTKFRASRDGEGNFKIEQSLT